MIRSVKKRLSGVRTRARELAPQRRLLGLVGLCGDGMKWHNNQMNELRTKTGHATQQFRRQTLLPQLQSTRLSGPGPGDIIQAVALVGHTLSSICSQNPTLNHPRIISKTGWPPRRTRALVPVYAVHITCTDFAQISRPGSVCEVRR